jgi:hypothetical protein
MNYGLINEITNLSITWKGILNPTSSFDHETNNLDHYWQWHKKWWKGSQGSTVSILNKWYIYLKPCSQKLAKFKTTNDTPAFSKYSLKPQVCFQILNIGWVYLQFPILWGFLITFLYDKSHRLTGDLGDFQLIKSQ